MKRSAIRRAGSGLGPGAERPAAALSRGGPPTRPMAYAVSTRSRGLGDPAGRVPASPQPGPCLVTLEVVLLILVLAIVSNVVLLVGAVASGAFRDRPADRPALPTPRGRVAVAPDLALVPRPRHDDRAPDADARVAASSSPAPFAALALPVPERRAAISAPAVPAPSTDGDRPAPVELAGEADAASVAATPAPSRPPSRPRATRGGSTTPRPTNARGGRTRRFTLPSIEVDHARTERVVLSLLGDPAPGEAPATEMVGAWERLVGASADESMPAPASVVALTLDGLDALTESAGREGAERFVTAVLDAVRRSARASDRVASVGRGHFRVLLVDADDAIAARFVTRVRGMLDRRLAMSPTPLHLSAGWAAAASPRELDGAVKGAEERRRAGTTGVSQQGQTPA